MSKENGKVGKKEQGKSPFPWEQHRFWLTAGE